MTQERLRPEGQNLEAAEKGRIGRLKRMLSSVIRKEKRVGDPEIEINIFENRHRSEEETIGMEELYGKADVVLLEVFGWTPKYLKYLRKLSYGKITPDELLEMMETKVGTNEYARDESLFELIRGKGKAIGIIDLPYGHPLYERIDENTFPEIHFGSGFDQTVVSVREHIEKFASMQQERETYKVEHLQPQIKELINTDDELRKKKQINVLMSIGGGHLQLPQKLKDQYQSINEFSTAPRNFLYYDEAIIRQMYGMPLEDDLIVRVITQRVLSKVDKSTFVTSDSVEDSRSIRSLVSVFNLEQLKSMFDKARDNGDLEHIFRRRSDRTQKLAVAAK